jgi:geranylgeranyl diphosphate synthase type II
MPARAPRRHLYDPAVDYPLRPSKMLRAGMCVATCLAHGGRLEDVLDSAVAIELLHNAFMVHDDIEDDSTVRRGRPALHVEHGVPIALNVGDALAFLALGPLLDNTERLGSDVSMRILREVYVVVTRTVEGQAIDLGWVRDECFDVGERDYMAMVLLKTCWYSTILPCRVGRLVATGRLGPDDFVRFGTYFGTSFQIRDDVLNLDGAAETYGKEIGGDIHEGKRTLALIHLLRSCPAAERAEVLDIYRRPRAERGRREIGRVIELMREYGSIEHASSAAHGLAGAAIAALDEELEELPDSEHARVLRALVPHLIGRLR